MKSLINTRTTHATTGLGMLVAAGALMLGADAAPGAVAATTTAPARASGPLVTHDLAARTPPARLFSRAARHRSAPRDHVSIAIARMKRAGDEIAHKPYIYGGG